MAVGGVIGIIQLILKIKRKPLKVTALCVFSALVLTVSVITAPILLFIFSSEEHVVERDGEKYLARVVAWMDTDVSYFEYKNFLVQGRQLKISEWYGSGAFDPFVGDHEYSPRRTIYYDDDGNIVEVVEDSKEN